MASTKKSAKPAKAAAKTASSSDKPAFKNTAKAQEAARAGDVDRAVTALRIFADKGDVLASCSLAALHGFRGEWDDVIARVQPLFSKPGATYANVLLDMVGLLWRAAEETGRWADASAALKKLPKKYASDLVMIGLVVPYLASGGKGKKPAVDSGPEGTVAERKKRFETYSKNAKATKDAHLAFYAAADDPMFDDEAIAAFPKAKPELDFQLTMKAAKAFNRKGRPDDAWKAFEPKLTEWMEDEEAQIAPAELLYDPDLRPMMTPARCKKVLERNA
jgi:hypothetical protein